MAIHACRKRRLPVSRSMRQWLRSLSLTVIVSGLVAPYGARFATAQVSAQTDTSDDTTTGIHALIAAGLPRGVWIPLSLHDAVGRMLERSPTFRDQCGRIDRHRGVHIGVTQNDWKLRGRSSGALAEIRRYTTGVIAVSITLPSGNAPYEALAHEMEHVLEVLDGVRLQKLAGSILGAGKAWQTTGGIETRRAIDVGRRVAEEVNRAGTLTSRGPVARSP